MCDTELVNTVQYQLIFLGLYTKYQSSNTYDLTKEINVSQVGTICKAKEIALDFCNHYFFDCETRSQMRSLLLSFDDHIFPEDLKYL